MIAFELGFVKTANIDRIHEGVNKAHPFWEYAARGEPFPMFPPEFMKAVNEQKKLVNILGLSNLKDRLVSILSKVRG